MFNPAVSIFLPEVFEISVRWYGLFVGAAALISWLGFVLVSRLSATVKALTQVRVLNVNLLFLALLAGGVMGGRAAFLTLFSPSENLTLIDMVDLSRGGVSIFGVFAGGFVATCIIARFSRVSTRSLLDVLVIMAPVAIALVRLGNLANNELWGDPILGSGDRHPSQLYEAAGSLVFMGPIIAILAFRTTILKHQGALTGSFLILYGVLRLCVDCTRLNTLDEQDLLIPSVFGAIACLVIGSALLTAIHVNSQFSTESGMQLMGERLAGAGFVAGSATVGVILAGCGGPYSDVPNSPLPTTRVVYSNPGSDARCTCAGSRAVFIVHDETGPRRISWVENRTDRISGQVYDPQDVTDLISPGPGNQRFLGCTSDAPDTSCRFDIRYAVRSTQSQMALHSLDLQASLGQFTYPDLASCAAICSSENPGRDCLQLGVRYYKAVAPIVELIKNADQEEGIVPKGDVLDALGITEEDDTCNRGDVIISGGIARNTGEAEACLFPSEELPRAALANVGLLHDVRAPLRMIGALPKTTMVRSGGEMRAINAVETAVAVDDATAPYLTFDGVMGAEATRRYGGPIQSLARIAAPGRPRQTVLSTSNGCIAVSEPRS